MNKKTIALIQGDPGGIGQLGQSPRARYSGQTGRMPLSLDHALDWATDHKHGVLVTLRRDGRPQTSDIVYAVIDGAIVVSLTATVRWCTTTVGNSSSRSAYPIGFGQGWCRCRGAGGRRATEMMAPLSTISPMTATPIGAAAPLISTHASKWHR